jgi:hypothetical protein
MHTIDDDLLVLYHYDDGLAPGQREAIEAALRESLPLRQRLAQLRATLAAVDREALPEPDAGFEDRIWRRLQAQLPPGTAASVTALPQRVAKQRRWPQIVGLAMAASVLLAIGFIVGRQPSFGPGAAPDTQAMATRVLDAYVAMHLRDTAGMLQAVSTQDASAESADQAEVAAALLESNRLYARAAARAGNTRLADFLQRIEPVLIELANPPTGGDISVRSGIVDYVRENDLLFQLRATESNLQSRGSRRT